MLEKLVELMGEEACREGIHQYLVTYGYNNATWDNLIEILDARTDKNLAAFSAVWVNSKGMPWIDFSIEGDSLVVKQSDPYNRGLNWPQSFMVAMVGKEGLSGRLQEIEIILSGEAVKIPIDREATYVLPNCCGRGYGYFRYPAASLEWILENWYRIGDETCRQAQLMNLYEAFQHGEIDANTWLNSLVKGLPFEKNALVASTVCSYIGAPLVEAGNGGVEVALMELTESHPLKSCRQQLLRALISAASEESVCNKLYEIWAAAKHPLLSENDYMTLAYELAILYPEKQQEIISTQSARIHNPDRKQQFEFIARATAPDTAAQEELFHYLLKAENRRTEPWALKTLGYLCHRSREGQAVKYIRPALDSLEYIQRTSDIFFPQNWTRTLLGNRYSPEALAQVEEFLIDNPNLQPLLRSKILQAAWSLQRRAK